MSGLVDNARDSILLIEDEFEVRRATVAYLEKHGFQVAPSSTGEEGLGLFQANSFRLVVLDLNLPALDGMGVLKKIRERSNVPVLVVSARQGGKDRISALENGADDFLTKPYLPQELLARIRAVLRRAKLPSILEESDRALVLDPGSRSVILHGTRVKVTPTEFAVISVLMGQPTRAFSREELLKEVWGEDANDAKSLRKVDIQVSRLRARLASLEVGEVLESVYGVGYQFAARFR